MTQASIRFHHQTSPVPLPIHCFCLDYYEQRIRKLYNKARKGWQIVEEHKIQSGADEKRHRNGGK